MKQPTYPREGTKLRIILDMLIAAEGYPVGLHLMMRQANAGAAHSCVSDLRIKHGWNIKNRMKHVTKDGLTEVHSEYWIPLEDAA